MIVEVLSEPVECSKAEGNAPYPAHAFRVTGGQTAPVAKPTDTAYVFSRGRAVLRRGTGPDAPVYRLPPGSFFACPGPLEVTAEHAVVVVRRGYAGLFLLGGPIEELGRLKYIDGCSDTLLLAPPKKGDPCLNHLHFPRGISQTMHTHPTARVGMVARGSGKCVTPDGDTPLVAGMCWYLEAGAPHCFFTGPGETMDIIAWHPDTDVGPTDESHPMVRRTYVDGVSAALLPDLHTKDIK